MDLWLISGYFLKWGIIISLKYSILDTLYTVIFLLALKYTAPTPKKSLILYKISTSLICKFISIEVLTLHWFYSNISIIKEKTTINKTS